MEHTFYKYQATGNDFILLDNRNGAFPGDDAQVVARLCDRRFGIGADGLILLEDAEEADFRMVYFNADGKPGSMCGNGGRCIAAFASFLGLISGSCTFVAHDGVHHARLEDGNVSLSMAEVSGVRVKPQYCFLNTGSPHHVQEVDDLEHLDVRKEGERLRYGLYGKQGSNINFVRLGGDGTLHVRTYERGVEDETYSCGTGVTAAALALAETERIRSSRISVETRGGSLEVSFRKNEGKYSEIWLTGPARQVFKGTVDL